jgi:hypothetical protein
MVSILDILRYFGYSNPEAVYQTISQDELFKLIRLYYILTN